MDGPDHLQYNQRTQCLVSSLRDNKKLSRESELKIKQ